MLVFLESSWAIHCLKKSSAYIVREKKWFKKKLEKLTETVRHVLSLQQQL